MPAQSLLLKHCTQVCPVVSQMCPKAPVQSSLTMHWTHVSVIMSQIGRALPPASVPQLALLRH
jgi:hypothetical protein